MIGNGPWNEKWNEIAPLDGGGQGDTFLVKSVSGEPARAVLKLLKAHKARDGKARGRMAQEVINLKVLHNAGGKVPKVLEDNTEKFEDPSCPLYFVMELIEGKTLADVIKAGPMLVGTAVHVVLDLCCTVRLAVNAGIAHRDIKPENIIIRGLVPVDAVMVDFGLSFNQDDNVNRTDTDETLDNKFLSLPERRGPGENKRDFRSDLTGLCGILLYCLTQCCPRNLRDSQGRPPHRSPNYSIDKRVQDPIQLAFLNALLDRGLSYELDLRFQTVEELVKRLEEVISPPSGQPSEDLEAVAARETAALKKNDRLTQLSDFFQVVFMSGFLTPYLGKINQMLAKSGGFSLEQAVPIVRGNGKFLEGDLVCESRLRVRVSNYGHNVVLIYSIAAHGLECVVYRQTVDAGVTSLGMDTPRSKPAVVLRYQGHTRPDASVLQKDIEAAVAGSITALTKHILGRQ